MTVEEFYAQMRKYGFTQYKTIGFGIRTTLMQGPESQIVSAPCPEDLTFDQRADELLKFMRTHVNQQ